MSAWMEVEVEAITKRTDRVSILEAIKFIAGYSEICVGYKDSQLDGALSHQYVAFSICEDGHGAIDFIKELDKQLNSLTIEYSITVKHMTLGGKK